MANCPDGYHWDEKFNACVQDIKETVVYKSNGDGHFLRNVATLGIGFLIGFCALWSWTFGTILIIGFVILLGYLLFKGDGGLKFPVIGFVIGIVLSYWATIAGIWNLITKLAGH